MYYDLLTKIKNAQSRNKETITSSYSRMDFDVARALQDGGYVAEVTKKVVNRKNSLEVKLLYKDGQPAISGIKLVSKPGRRMYTGYKEIKSVRQGYGVGVLSTPGGIMLTNKARQAKVGGEYLFQIW